MAIAMNVVRTRKRFSKVVRKKVQSELSQRINASFQSESQDDKIIRKILTGIGSPRALGVWLLYSHKEHEQLVDLECNPNGYIDSELFRADYCATELLSKADFLSLTRDRKRIALDRFLAAEEQCRVTNHLLREVAHSAVEGCIKDFPLVSCLSDMAYKIDSVLGDFCADEFIDACAWGPGATYFLPRKYANQYTKYLRERGATTECHQFIAPWFSIAYPLWSRASGLDHSIVSTRGLAVEIAPGNKVITVPKNAKQDRVICVEPGLNLWFQKGIGMMIRRRLRRAGNSIDFQTRNQELCRLAVERRLATVDFSAASDTISLELVRQVIPREWLAVMDKFRSASGTLDGAVTKWEKYSTMGNGFTFELETLIFWALAQHVCGVLGISSQDVSVFGDDVILPVDAFHLFQDLSSKLGFTVNVKKSHVDGWFRESCGVHYFERLDTKPLYIKSRPNRLQDIYKLVNGIRNLSHRWMAGYGCDIRFLSPWLDARERVPQDLRFYGPSHLGDTVIWANVDECSPSRSKRGFDAWSIRSLGETSRKFRGRSWHAWLAERVRCVRGSEVSFKKEDGALVCSCDLSSTPSLGLINRGGRGKTIVHQGTLVSRWDNLGGWLNG